jgi:hypothetical protein
LTREWFLYKGRRYHKVGEMYCGGVTKLMLLPEEIDNLHLNHEHLVLVEEDKVSSPCQGELEYENKDN